MYSKSIQNLIDSFRRLPTVGQRTAERFVFYLLKSGKKEVGEITLALKELIDNVKSCETCWDFSDNNPCAICSNKSRDTSLLCVVSEPQDIPVIERTGMYKGLYHVLRGLVEAGDEEGMERIKIKELFEKIKNTPPSIPPLKGEGQGVRFKEMILALNPDLSGETTMLYLEREIKKLNPNLKITRLARGLPMGSDLQYADEITLGSALKNRTER